MGESLSQEAGPRVTHRGGLFGVAGGAYEQEEEARRPRRRLHCSAKGEEVEVVDGTVSTKRVGRAQETNSTTRASFGASRLRSPEDGDGAVADIVRA